MCASIIRILTLLALISSVPVALSKEVPLVADTQVPITAPDGKIIGSMKLPAGALVEIVSVQQDGVMVRRGEGTPFKVALTAVPSTATATPTPAPTPAAPTPTPPQTTAIAATITPSSTSGSDFVSVHPPLKVGANTVQLETLPVPFIKPSWFDYKFDPTQEKFQVYIPKGFDPKKTYGVIGWTNPRDRFGMPDQFFPLFDEFNLIGVSADKCGNNQDSKRRVGLLVSAILQLEKTLPIDKKRILLSGLSGGGRVSALGGFVHPEFFSGVVSWCGGHFYKDYPDSTRPGYVVYGIPNCEKTSNAVTPQNVSDAKRQVRFVQITGEKDFNLVNSRDIEKALKQEGFQSLLIEEPGLGHRVGSVESMRKALVFVLGEPSKH
jgi:esterase/lipase superfamily enzyme